MGIFAHVMGNIRPRDVFRPIARERKYLMDYNLIYTPFTTNEKTSSTELSGRSFTNGFSGPKSFRDFRETGLRCDWFCFSLVQKLDFRANYKALQTQLLHCFRQSIENYSKQTDCGANPPETLPFLSEGIKGDYHALPAVD